MPSLAALHPQVVHFVVALVIVGVLFRMLSIALRAAWLSPAALALVALGTLASVVAVRSGVDAHGPVERVPGARAAVVEHEEWGERARSVFLILLAVEAVAATLTARKPTAARAAKLAAAVVGLGAVAVLYRAADLGGRLVYGYAGGVAVNTGDPEDVGRLLIAAAHQQANLDRQSGKLGDAAAIIDVVADRFPAHLELQLARVDSIINDRKDPTEALTRLDTIQLPTEDTRLRVRAGLLRSGALAAAGDLSAARQVLETLKSEFPTNTQVQRRLAEITQPR
jgi:uncharacterized membrane protein